MLGTRHEEYEPLTNGLPFVLNANLHRTKYDCSKENNWHDNLEIQICAEGSGNVLLDGEKYPFGKNDIVVINSNVLHYTGTDTSLIYHCLIVSTDFCKQVGIDTGFISFSPHIRSAALVDLFGELTEVFLKADLPCRKAKLNKLVLEILIELAEHHAAEQAAFGTEDKRFDTVKAVISYIRAHYAQKVTLDGISKAVLFDKYALCREFKRLTGQTIIENLNHYRCIKAIECLSAGYTVARTASLCGFDNLSFFSKTFKKHTGKLPSAYKKQSL